MLEKIKRRFTANSGQLVYIPISSIYPNPAQPRKTFIKSELEELSASIKEAGLIQPITVRRDSRNGYQLIAGERRLRACAMAGLKDIPCIISDMDDKQSSIVALVENLQRCDLNFFEEAAAIYSLMQEKSITQEEAARRLGMSQPALANKVRLLRFTGEEQRIILEGKLTERHARALLRLEDPIQRARTMNTIIRRGLNVAQSEELIKLLLEEKPKKKKPKRTFIAKDIRLFLNTIDRAVAAVKDAGIGAVSQKRETEEYYEYVVQIPKKSSSTR